MRIKLSIICLLLALGVASCGDDDEECTSLSETIVGNWMTNSGNFEFQSDGTLVDEDNTILNPVLLGTTYDMSSWTTTGMDTLLLIASNSMKVDTIYAEATIVSCNEIILSIAGFPITVERIE